MRPSLLSLLCVRTASLSIVSCIATIILADCIRQHKSLFALHFGCFFSLFLVPLAMKKPSCSDKTVGNSAMSTKIIIEPAYAC